MSEVKLFLGDCLEVMRGLPDASIDAVVTDPPYGASKDRDDYIATEFLVSAYRVLKPNTAMLMCVGQATIRQFWDEAERVGFRWLNTIIWHYRNTIKRETRRFAIQYDPILYFAKGDFLHRLDAVRVPYLHPERLKYPVNNKKHIGWMPNPKGAICGDVWGFPAIVTTAHSGNDDKTEHKWQKPIALMERMILCSTDEGASILDPFMGSGTTGVVCVRTDRNFIGIEISETYFKIAEKRIAEAQMQTRMEFA